MSCPSAIGVRSTSIGAPAAMVEASGFIWETSGQTAAAAPTAATAPVATKRKSRRVGSAEDAVVTIPNPFSSATGETAPVMRQRAAGKAAGARGPRGGRMSACPAQSGGTDSPESFYWHPCRTSASPLSADLVQCTKSTRAAVTFSATSGPQGLIAAHAHCPFPARHSAEHRNDSPAVRLPRMSRPISSSPPASRSAIAISAARAWIISTRSRIVRHDSWPFQQWRIDEARRLLLFTTKAHSLSGSSLCDTDILLFGRESAAYPTRSPLPPTPGW